MATTRKNEIIYDTDKEMKIVLDPYRAKIIKVYEDSKEPLTVKQVADSLGEVPAKVHYHVKKLLSIDLLELDKTKIINGIVAKYYRLKYKYMIIDSTNLSSNLYLAASNIMEKQFNDGVIFFRKHLRKHLELVKEDKDFEQRQVRVSYFKLYMTKEEYEEYIKRNSAYYLKYRKKDETKEVFSCTFSSVRIK